MRVILALMASAILGLTAGRATAVPAYAVGQVWSYQTRPEDSGSLLKIGAIESVPAGVVYHISVIKVHLGPDRGQTDIGHLPVSQQTLDASVTTLTPTDAAFPDPSEGIAQWRAAKGGVFTLPVREIIKTLDATIQSPAE